MKKLPDAIAKRDLLFAKKTPAVESELAAFGQALEESSWLSDAADFFSQSKDKAALQRLRQKSVAEGNSFLFLKAQRLLGDEDFPKAELLECARQAEKQGKIRYAIKAYERLEDNAEAARLSVLIAGDGDRISEAESKVFIPAGQDEIKDDESN